MAISEGGETMNDGICGKIGETCGMIALLSGIVSYLHLMFEVYGYTWFYSLVAAVGFGIAWLILTTFQTVIDGGE